MESVIVYEIWIWLENRFWKISDGSDMKISTFSLFSSNSQLSSIFPPSWQEHIQWANFSLAMNAFLNGQVLVIDEELQLYLLWMLFGVTFFLKFNLFFNHWRNHAKITGQTLNNLYFLRWWTWDERCIRSTRYLHWILPWICWFKQQSKNTFHAQKRVRPCAIYSIANVVTSFTEHSVWN